MSVDVSAIVDTISDVVLVGSAVMIILVAIAAKDLIKEFLLGVIFDANNPDNYDSDSNPGGKFG